MGEDFGLHINEQDTFVVGEPRELSRMRSYSFALEFAATLDKRSPPEGFRRRTNPAVFC
jgi:hypothetical protein